MKDVRDELVRLVYKTVFICIAVFIIAVFVKDFYLNIGKIMRLLRWLLMYSGFFIMTRLEKYG